MSKWDSDSELDNYFQRSLKELNWDKIEKENYLMKYAEILAVEIVEEEVDPIKASKTIYQILIDLDYPSELQGWFAINEMICDYEYFLKTKRKSYWFREKEELNLEIKRVSEDLLKSKNLFSYVFINPFPIKTTRHDECFKPGSC